MTKRTYRTAQGKTIDLGALQLKNEHVRAVGNMGVNARGDIIDSNNRPIASRNSQIDKQYQKQISNVKNTPVSSSNQSNAHKKSSVSLEGLDTVLPPEDFGDNFEKAIIDKNRNQ